MDISSRVMLFFPGFWAITTEVESEMITGRDVRAFGPPNSYLDIMQHAKTEPEERPRSLPCQVVVETQDASFAIKNC